MVGPELSLLWLSTIAILTVGGICARYVRELVTSEELADSKTNFIGRLPLSLETNNGVASALVNLEKFDLGLDYYERYAEHVQAITAEQVLETAQRYLDPDRLGIGIAGP